MKRLFVLTFLLSIFCGSLRVLATDDPGCLITSGESSLYAVTGGRYKPAKNASGEFMRALIVFAQFSGDTSVISNWTKDSKPTWAGNLIDSTVSSSYRNLTISDYFKDMSNGDFDFIGDVYPNVITVGSDLTYGNANKIVLDTLNKYRVDFKKYDNWSFNGTQFVFSSRNGDGYLDMLIVIYRNGLSTFNSSLAGGIACLSLPSEYTTYDGTKINGLSTDTRGSGITSNTRGKVYDELAYSTHLAHEYGHYLFGSGHVRVGGLMAGAPYGYNGDTKAMSAWERERLGYISTYLAGYDGYIKTIGDYVTSRDAIKVTVPYNSSTSGEYLMIENHQRVSPYDQIIRGGAIEGALDPNTQIGKGIYVWYIRDGNSYPPNIYAISADGLWNWAFDSWISMPEGWPSQLALIKKNGVNRNMDSGISDRDPMLLYYDNQYWDRWHDYNLVTNQWELTREVMGDETDAFNIGYNQYITPWSNPSTTKTGGTTNIAIELNSQSGNNITIKTYSTSSSSQNLPPSRPQNLLMSANNDGLVRLTWTANTEPDLSLYEISRYAPDNLGTYVWAVIATTTNTYYVDSDYGYAPGAGDITPHYKIRAKDSQNYYSNYSDEVANRAEYMHKEVVAEKTEATGKDNFVLSNYPNPFNPSTSIVFTLNKNAFVKLKIYDILGREVGNLLNEYREMGSYTFSFNGSFLSSGIYLCRLEINNEIFTKKLILNK